MNRESSVVSLNTLNYSRLTFHVSRLTVMSYIIEIATSDFLTTKSAVEGGADRIELCANLAEGGTTPSYAHVKKMQGSVFYSIISHHPAQRR